MWVNDMLRLPCLEPLNLPFLVHSHGWVKLEPFHWDETKGQLTHTMWLQSGSLCRWEVEQVHPTLLKLQIRSQQTLTEVDVDEVKAGVRWALRLDESYTGFYDLCRRYPALHASGESFGGRLLRSPTVWEDVAKTICTTCTTWGRTRSMVSALCDSPTAALTNPQPFPTPAAIAAATEADLRQVAGMGYRARYLHAIARKVAAGEIDLESLKGDTRPTDDLRSDLLNLPGIGPYAAANLLMLLGRYDHIALDSWVRRVVGKGWFGGRPVKDSEILQAFERFGPWKALVYWFWDWERAAEEWSWREG